MDDNLKDAYGKALELTEIAKRNPKVGNMSPKVRVGKYVRRKSETGSPEPVNRVTRAKHNAAMQDFLEDRGLANLPRLSERSETGGPKEDLNEISGQLTKASNLHARQSDRVGKIAKKMK